MLLVVAAALWNAQGEVFVQQRPEGKTMAGLWEFAGGKVHEGEAPEWALARELHEELGIMVDPHRLTPLSFVTYPWLSATRNSREQQETDMPHFRLARDTMLLLLYGCSEWEGELTPMEGQVGRWVDAATLRTLPMPPADLPLIPYAFPQQVHHGELV
jgi:8-oxo-dGTP diphosphatase